MPLRGVGKGGRALGCATYHITGFGMPNYGSFELKNGRPFYSTDQNYRRLKHSSSIHLVRISTQSKIFVSLGKTLRTPVRALCSWGSTRVLVFKSSSVLEHVFWSVGPGIVSSRVRGENCLGYRNFGFGDVFMWLCIYVSCVWFCNGGRGSRNFLG